MWIIHWHMKKNRNFNIVLAGQVISLFGSSIQRFCLSLYLLEPTGSTAVYGNILALSVLPYIFLAPAAGMAADVYSRKKIMIVLDVLAGCLLLIYSICFFTGIDSAWLAAAVMIILSGISTFYNPAVTACLPQIVEADRLRYANSCISQVGAWSNILGPVLAGVLYGFLDIRHIVLINALSFLFSAGLEGFIHMPHIPLRDRAEFRLSVSFLHMGNTWKGLKNQYHVVRNIIISYGMYNICIVPVNGILFPAVINLELNLPSQVFGIIEGMLMCGMLLSSILVAWKSGWFSIRRIYLWNLPMPAVLLIMGITLRTGADPVIKAAVMGVSGLVIMFCLGVGNIVTLTYTQSTVPTHMLGSVSALSTAVATATVPVGQVSFGYIMESGISSYALLILATAAAAAVCWFIRRNFSP